jgi:serine/threonine protein kinase
VKIYDFLETDLDFYIVLEFCNLGDLEHNFKNLDHYHLLIDILRGFLLMVKKGIIHRDIKPANILLHKYNNVAHFKLCDFGFAQQIANLKNSKLTTKVGTPLYMSP